MRGPAAPLDESIALRTSATVKAMDHHQEVVPVALLVLTIVDAFRELCPCWHPRAGQVPPDPLTPSEIDRPRKPRVLIQEKLQV